MFNHLENILILHQTFHMRINVFSKPNPFQAGSPITVKELLVTDEDTPPSDIMFVITTPPTFGILEHIASPGESVMTFTQSRCSCY